MYECGTLVSVLFDTGIQSAIYIDEDCEGHRVLIDDGSEQGNDIVVEEWRLSR
jgi:hypothetical protein